MPFKKVLIALDGSQYSQMAAEYGIWLATSLGAGLTGQHVVDPRLVDLFIAPEFAEELGFSRSIETSEKVFSALRKIGKEVLELFALEAAAHGLKADTFLDEGHVAEEIVKYAESYDLLVIGHRGRGCRREASELILGSVAEYVATNSGSPVLVAIQPVSAMKQILVAYDGSEASRGALIMAEALAKSAGKTLKALTVVPSADQFPQARLLVEQGEKYLRESWQEDVFCIKEGSVADNLLELASTSHSLLVLGAYGFADPSMNVLGRTISRVIRQSGTSVLIYKAGAQAATQSDALAAQETAVSPV